MPVAQKSEPKPQKRGPRRKSTLEAIGWKYGAKSPRGENADVLREQMRAAHDLRNTYVDLENQRRQDFYDLERALFPKFHALQESIAKRRDEIEELRTQAKKINSKARKREINAALRAQIVQAKDALKPEIEKFKTLREKVRSSKRLQRAQQPLAVIHKSRVKLAEHESPCFWGTQGYVKEAAQSMKSGPPPRKRPWTGAGFVAIRFRTPITPDELFSGKNKRAWLEPQEKTDRNKNGVVKRTTFHIAIASAGGRKMIMASLPVYVHRQFPPNCEIVGVQVHCRKIARQEKWSVTFCIRGPSFAKPDVAESGMAAVNFGWRKVPDGLRVATVLSEDRELEHLILPDHIIGSFRYADSIRSIRDDLWNETVANTHAWRKKNLGILPKWFADDTKGIRNWKAKGRLANLLRKWAENRFDGDKSLYVKLTKKGTPEHGFRDAGWLHRDRHLWDIEANVRDNACQRRKYIYREFAAQMRRKYKRIVTTKLALKTMQRKLNPEESRDGGVTEYARIAAISILQSAMKNSLRDGWVELPAAPVTSTCHLCRKKQKFEEPAALIQVCQKCGAAWDQDTNACENTFTLLPKRHTQKQETK